MLMVPLERKQLLEIEVVKMRKSKLFAAILVCFTSVLILTSQLGNAREIGQLSRFRITPTFTGTAYLQKMNSSYYIVNLDAKSPQIRVKHYLANSNGARRSDIDMTWTGNRGVYTNNAQAGYIYNLNLARENFWDGAFFIDGSWSPDSN